jgi:hypothetical protein
MDNPDRNMQTGKQHTVTPMPVDEFKRQALLVLDRKTGELYDPEAKFRELMNDELTQATFKRLADK